MIDLCLVRPVKILRLVDPFAGSITDKGRIKHKDAFA